MAIYTKKEFAELCKQGTNYLSVQIKRGKLILSADGKIDTADSINKSYLEKIYGRMDFVPDPKKEAVRLSSIKTEKPEPPSDEEGESDEEVAIDSLLNSENRSNLSYPELERIYKYLQGKKIEKDIEKNQLDIEKKKGVVVPSELIKPVFLQHNQFILTEFKNTADEIIRRIAKKKDLNVNEMAEIRGEMVQCINEAVNKAIAASTKNIVNIITDFSDKRGVGERA